MLIHIQTIATKLKIKHNKIKEVARELFISPKKLSKDCYELYSEEDANKILAKIINE